MNSLYKKMNMINDEESLSEKYNVKNAKELKKLTEAANDKLYRVDIFSYTHS